MSYLLPENVGARPSVSPGLAIPKVNRLPELEFMDSLTCPANKKSIFEGV
jgi:hypothetical protein